MLHWRIFLGVVLIAALAGLCWLDHLAGLPGAWLLPLALGLSVLASGEILRLSKSAGLKPIGPLVYCGNFLLVLSAWAPMAWQRFFSEPAVASGRDPTAVSASGPMLVLATFVLLAFWGEMARYDRSKGVMSNLGATVLSLVYVGLMLAVIVQMRLARGIGALAALVIVVKMGDTGAYTVGRLVGRHKMAPILSPGKTIEGAIGAVVFSTFGAWLSFTLIVPRLADATNPVVAAGATTQWWGWAAFGVVVGVSGLLADLAESLLKRDAGCKDSSDWMPGFGGVLDVLDSILLASPIACIFWSLGLVKCC